jgi:2,3-bisphosphoglycerate-dependent phosphoglycerate mutase
MADLELWLVRHGETSASRDGRLAGWDDVPLTERGVEQARALRPLLEDERFAGVWSSDLQRAVATARLAWGPADDDARLREIHFGALEGHGWEDLDGRHKQALVAFAGFDFPGGETVEQVGARVEAFLAGLEAGRHLLFTHGGVIRLLSRQVGEMEFVATGTVLALDWSRKAVLFRRENAIPSPLPFAK